MCVWLDRAAGQKGLLGTKPGFFGNFVPPFLLIPFCCQTIWLSRSIALRRSCIQNEFFLGVYSFGYS